MALSIKWMSVGTRGDHSPYERGPVHDTFSLASIRSLLPYADLSAAIPPLDMPKRLILPAKIVQQSMYVSLTLIGVTVFAIGGLYYSGGKEGLLLEALLLAHEVFYWVSVNLMGVHIAGALYHRFKGDGVWDAMVPFFKERA